MQLVLVDILFIITPIVSTVFITWKMIILILFSRWFDTSS